MATTETEIMNLALMLVGHDTQSSIDNGTKGAELCKLRLPMVRDTLLRMHPWNFAVRRVALSREVATPNHEFSYSFLLPSDCLKVIRTNYETDDYPAAAVYGFPGLVGGYTTPIPYRIENNRLLMNEETVSIEYIARVTEVAKWDVLFQDLVAQRLAAEISPALTDNGASTTRLWEIYQLKLAEARISDAQEGTPRDIIDTSSWVAARM